MNLSKCIKSINKDYLELLEEYSVKITGETIDEIHRLDTHDIIRSLYTRTENRILIGYNSKTRLNFHLDNFHTSICAFWDKNDSLLLNYITNEKVNGIILWQDMEPDKLASKYLLFYDTIFIPCPFFEYSSFWEEVNEDMKISIVIFWLKLCASLKPYITANTDKPLVAFYAQKYGYTNTGSSKIIQASAEINIKFLKSFLGHDIGNNREDIRRHVKTQCQQANQP